MSYYKTEQLANEYQVSVRTVQRWITWAKNKKISLDLIDIGKRSFIVNSPSNIIKIQELLQTNKKYKNKIGLQTILPKQEFYKLYNESQIIDIINNLEIFKELQHKYCFFNGGALYWDKYINRVLNENEPITIKSTLELLNFDKNYLLALVEKYENINIVDIGPGNGMAIKDFINFIQSNNKLRKYIAIDFSPDILNVTEQNMKSWFGESFPFEGHVRDVTRDSFQELLFQNTHFPEMEDQNTINLVFFMGSTIENERHYEKTLSNIVSCLGKKDIFILGQLLDTPRARMHINFQPKEKVREEDFDVEKLIFALIDLMNIKEEFYEVERFYSAEERARIIRLRLKHDLELKIATPTIKKSIFFNNKEQIIIFRHNHHTSREVMNTMNDLGFEILKTSISLDKQQILVISKIKTVGE